MDFSQFLVTYVVGGLVGYAIAHFWNADKIKCLKKRLHEQEHVLEDVASLIGELLARSVKCDNKLPKGEKNAVSNRAGKRAYRKSNRASK